MKTWNGKRPGETGKGNADRSNRKKVSEGMDRIKDQPWMTCGGCKSFNNGFDALGNTLCKKGIKFNLNNSKRSYCDEWEDVKENEK